MRRLLAVLLGGPALAVSPGSAIAETSRSFEVSAQIVSGCLVATDASGRWGDVDLGTVAGVGGTTVSANLVSSAGGGVSVECTPGVSAALTADNGDHPAGGERRLLRAGGSATIRYRLLATEAQIVWTSAALPLAFTSGPRLVPIRVVATLDGPMAAGTYTDTIRVTLSW